MISNKYIQSVLAKAIGDAKFLDALQDNTTVAGRLLGKNKAAYESVRRFSAFLCMVQHNFLLGAYPLTFKLLNKFKMKHDVFMGYLTIHQEMKRIKAANYEKETVFVTYLASYLSKRSAMMNKLVGDTLRHESTIRCLRYRQQHEPQEFPKGRRLKFCLDLPVKPIGNFELVELNFNPHEIARMETSEKNPRYNSKIQHYCYWLERGQKDATLFEIDPVLEQALRGINGKNTVSFLTAGMTKRFERTSLMVNFQMLYDMNLIYFSKNKVKTP